MAVTGAITGIVGAISGIAQGITSDQAQRKGRRQQRTAQEAATATSVAEQRKADEALAAANRQAPDVTSLLTAEQQDRLRGPTSTRLTGAAGVDPNRLKLGRTSLLGG